MIKKFSQSILKLNRRGFSLIELMVVVAIIAILATVAIPQYQLFQAKSRRNEAQTLLSGYYTAAQATYAELGTYPGNFVATGFQPGGQLHTRIVAANNGAAVLPTGTPNEPACISTSVACTTNGYGNMTATGSWSEITTGVWAAVAPTTAASIMNSPDQFTTVSGSMIKSGGNIDVWTINQVKAFGNPSNGLN